jgi:prepilin-type N-terminal cleavage/methylation domain-containing protein
MRGAKMRGRSGLTLIELLVGILIMGIVSTMLLTSWFALNRSYSYSVNSNIARDKARVAVARLEREIRDAEASTANAYPAVYRARTYWIAVYTTFNEAGNDVPLATASPPASRLPHLVVYRMYTNGQVWRYEDRNYDGTVGSINMTPDDPADFSLSERTTGEGRTLITTNAANLTNTSSPTALFRYNYYDTDGNLQSENAIYGDDNRRRVIAVQIHMLVDLNPARPPVYVDFLTTAALRNQRAL